VVWTCFLGLKPEAKSYSPFATKIQFDTYPKKAPPLPGAENLSRGYDLAQLRLFFQRPAQLLRNIGYGLILKTVPSLADPPYWVTP
jgi:hypothetical protein